MDTSIYCVADPLTGVEAHVFEHPASLPHVAHAPYVVRVLDTDAGEWVSGYQRFAYLDGAERYADRCVN